MSDSSTPRVIFIYTLSDPRTGEIRYVGKTTNPKDRLRCHLREARKPFDNHRLHWLRQLEAAGVRPILTVIDQATDETWIEAERRWIAHYRYLRYRLVNGTDGGDGAYGRVLPAESWARIRAGTSKALLGKPKSVEHRENIRKGLRGQIIPPEVRAKMSAAAKGKIVSAETRAKMSAVRTGTKRDPAGVLRGAEKRGKDFILTSPEGEEVPVHNLRAFCREHELTAGNFYGVLNGTHRDHKGWRIRRPEE